MSNISVVFVVANSAKADLEAYASGSAFDCVASREVRGAGTAVTTPTHYLGHAYCTAAERLVLSSAQGLGLLSMDSDVTGIKPRDHVDNVLTTFGLEFLPRED